MNKGEITYCGLDCAELLERLDDILEQCRIHSEYGGVEFAPVMVQKLIDRCNETKTELMHRVIQSKFP